jgi:hypothetical protein
MRDGLRFTAFAHALMSGSAFEDVTAREPRTCMRAQSAGVFAYGVGGHKRFFSSTASRVAST